MKKSIEKIFTFVIAASLFLAVTMFAAFEEQPPAVSPGDVAGKVDKAGDTMTGALTIITTGTPLNTENNTDAASNVGRTIYSNPATPADGDEVTDGWFVNNSGGVKTEFITLAGGARDTDSKSKDSFWEVRGFKDNVAITMVTFDAEISRYTVEGSMVADTYLFSGDPDLNSGIRGLVDDEVEVFVGGSDRVRHLPTVSNFLNRIGIGAGDTFNQVFKVVSNLFSSHPFPDQTTPQRDAIATPETGDGINNTTLGQWQRFNGSSWDGIATTNGNSINVMFSGGGDAFFTTTSTTYITAGIFRFGGTTELGTPTNIRAIGLKEASPTSWDVRVFDLTNSLEIAEATGNTGTVAELIDMGSLGNLPTAEAMFEVQLKRTGGTGGSMVFVHSISVLF